jgi:hypothetical protein
VGHYQRVLIDAAALDVDKERRLLIQRATQIATE